MSPTTSFCHNKTTWCFVIKTHRERIFDIFRIRVAKMCVTEGFTCHKNLYMTKICVTIVWRFFGVKCLLNKHKKNTFLLIPFLTQPPYFVIASTTSSLSNESSTPVSKKAQSFRQFGAP